MSEKRYFWNLDSSCATSEWQAFHAAMGGKRDSALARWVGLFEAHVPIAPKICLSPACETVAEKRPDAVFLEELDQALARLEKVAGLEFGRGNNPMLLTVQGDLCGAIRNIGLTSEVLPALIHQIGQEAALPLYVDFLESFSSLILGCPRIDFRKEFGLTADRHGHDQLKALDVQTFLGHVRNFEALVTKRTGRTFPDSPEAQLLSALIYCIRSARESGGADELFIHTQILKTVFGQSVQGLVYTRNPFTGKKDIYGLYQCAEGGDKKFPLEPDPAQDRQSLREKFPTLYSQLSRHLLTIEKVFHDVMEAEFVSDEEGHLYFVAFDKAETTARATIVSTIDLNTEGQLADREAALRIKPADLEVLLHPTLDDASRAKLQDLGSSGVTAAPGTSVGHVFFKMAEAMEYYKKAPAASRRVILVADELLISDTPGLGIISGLVTRASGVSSHAAVMARANGIPCIVGYRGLEIDSSATFCTIAGQRIDAGTLITLEAGSEGRLYRGEGTLSNLSFREGVIKDVSSLISRVIEHERIPLEVRVNINGAKDADVGVQFGADGVGLCRTENMFMEAEALREIRNIVFTQEPQACKESFAILERTQQGDFQKIFEVMKGKLVNIRLMDLPLHDFVPQTEGDFKALAAQLKHLDQAHLRAVAEGLKEHNPMLGLRACRFGIITPQVYEMQIRAIVRAAYTVAESGTSVDPGIMFPLVFTEAELQRLRARVIQIESEIRPTFKSVDPIAFRVGSMIELPAAALNADQLARVGEFFAFGTNDLTQTTLGMSRDDSAHYLPQYLEMNLLPADPFKVLSEPVRELVETAVRRGRRVRNDSSFGICGEQGGDPATLEFCLTRGLNYVSASPFRVLIARCALVRTYFALQSQTALEKSAA